jgi:RNA polymerase sigma factor (TIGR02999 family)
LYFYSDGQPIFGPLALPFAGIVAERAVYCSAVFLSGNILPFNNLMPYGSQGLRTVPRDMGEGIPFDSTSVWVSSMSEVTRVLSAIEEGDSHAADQLLPLVYDELRKLAAQKLAQEKPGQTLEATALVHEAYLRLVDVEKAQHWNSRAHFFTAAAEAMRRILIENARHKKRLKRGGNRERVDLDDAQVVSTAAPDELLLIDEAIAKLAAEDPQAAQLVRLRYFAGLSVEEAAAMSGLSRSSAYEHWSYARAWLRCELYGK